MTITGNSEQARASLLVCVPLYSEITGSNRLEAQDILKAFGLEASILPPNDIGSLVISLVNGKLEAMIS